MKAQLDKNGYFTGSYAKIGDLNGSIDTNIIPNDSDNIKLISYKYIGNDKWEFDENRYLSLLEEKQSKELLSIKYQMIKQSKNNLATFLNNAKVKSSCHGGVEKKYSVTAEKQQYLNTMIAVTKAGLQSSDNYRGSWNASGEESTCDWTLDELQQLAIEIESFVRPLILKQQKVEVMINNATTLKELESIDICFEQK